MKLETLSGETGQTADRNPALRAVAINEMRAATQLFEYAEFYSTTGNADTPLKAATVAGGNERAIGADYTPVDGAPSYASVALEILGDKIKTDLAFERRGGGIEGERVRQLRSFSKGVGRYFMFQFINGSGSANQIAGIKAQLSGSQIISLGTNGLQVPLGNLDATKSAQQTFIEALDKMIAEVSINAVLLMSPVQISRLTAIAREYCTFNSVDGVFGTVQRYNQTPIVNVGYSKDGSTPVLPQTETVGTATDTSSIYCVRFGEKEDVTIATNVGVQVRDLGLVSNNYETLIEMDAQVAILNSTSGRRLKGFRL